MDLKIVPLSEPSTAINAIYIFVLLLFASFVLVLVILGLREATLRKPGKKNAQMIGQKYAAELELSEKYPGISPMLDTRGIRHSLYSQVNTGERKRSRWNGIFPKFKGKRTEKMQNTSKDYDVKKSRLLPFYSGKNARTRSIEFRDPLESEKSGPDSDSNKNSGKSLYLHEFIGYDLGRKPYIEEIPEEEFTNHFDSQLVEPRPKIRFSVNELLKLNKAFEFSIPQGEKLRISQLLNSQAESPRAETDHIESDLIKINDYIKSSNGSIRCLGLFGFAALGSYLSPFSSYVHFHKGFCELMTYLIDNLVIYTEANVPVCLQVLLVDLCCCFAWEHWDGAIGGKLKVIEALQRVNEATTPENDSEQLKSDVGTGSTYQELKKNLSACDDTRKDVDSDYGNSADSHFNPYHPRLGEDGDYKDDRDDVATTLGSSGLDEQSVLRFLYKRQKQQHLIHEHEIITLPIDIVFRLFCNMYMGTPGITSLEVRSYCLFKVNAVFRACVSRLPCHQHRKVVPVLQEAVDTTRKNSVILFFYDILLDMVMKHLKCCITPADVFAPNLHIQSLVRRGLLAQQSVQVQERASRLKAAVAQKHSEARRWGALALEREVPPGGWPTPAWGTKMR